MTDALKRMSAAVHAFAAVADLIEWQSENGDPSAEAAEVLSALAALDAAIAARGEPVAWMMTPNKLSHRLLQRSVQFDKPVMRSDWVLTPLYTAPPAAAPLTDEQIETAARASVFDGEQADAYVSEWVKQIGEPFARAIERAHGIGA